MTSGSAAVREDCPPDAGGGPPSKRGRIGLYNPLNRSPFASRIRAWWLFTTQYSTPAAARPEGVLSTNRKRILFILKDLHDHAALASRVDYRLVTGNIYLPGGMG